MSLSCACRATGCRMAARRWHRPHTASASKWRGYQVRAKSLKILVRLCSCSCHSSARRAPPRSHGLHVQPHNRRCGGASAALGSRSHRKASPKPKFEGGVIWGAAGRLCRLPLLVPRVCFGGHLLPPQPLAPRFALARAIARLPPRGAAEQTARGRFSTCVFLCRPQPRAPRCVSARALHVRVCRRGLTTSNAPPPPPPNAAAPARDIQLAPFEVRRVTRERGALPQRARGRLGRPAPRWSAYGRACAPTAPRPDRPPIATGRALGRAVARSANLEPSSAAHAYFDLLPRSWDLV